MKLSRREFIKTNAIAATATTSSMDFTEQGRRAVNQHSHGLNEGKTCIDCHKGIAHQLPDMRTVDPSAVVGEK